MPTLDADSERTACGRFECGRHAVAAAFRRIVVAAVNAAGQQRSYVTRDQTLTLASVAADSAAANVWHFGDASTDE